MSRGPFQASEEQQRQVQEQITLLSTLFKLNHRCFKICLGNDKNYLENQKQAKILLYGKKNTSEYQNTKEDFKNCVQSCSYNYAKARGYIKDNFIKDMTIVQEKNDAIYDSFYNENKSYEDVVEEFKKKQFNFKSQPQ
ncbi:hypothetical protein TTHERM_00382250 (macronuclear) [Tetrahymena thermophila SB210]|uniref:Uncharacterized protein n=1 Tax=Tetrahymena thermophila (strain SB210) TaxID=312017 RepID=Q23F89_TETTS|nr:hypothetical protein TTHERM_00382250 [Tetrahymena thermophila SB210]EAR95264.1 hypothetical protein TTHERM_00382250 [Tetrahymena thermophila SB210]|eukprot:XP_001015509.1 hypothetical protein TTHERM_00382250 [Tetrahymena thermophila SB210]